MLTLLSNDLSYIGTARNIILCKRSNECMINLYVICDCSGSCYKRQMQPLSKTLNENPFIRKPHSIRLVEIPSSSELTRGVKLSIENSRHSASYYTAASFPK